MNTIKNALSQVLESLEDSFNLLWSVVSPILPRLALVAVLLIVGFWVATFIGNIIGTLIKKGKIDDVLDKFVFSHISKLSGTKWNASSLINFAVKWFLTATILIAALNIAHLSNVVDFFSQAIGYLPNIVIAVLIVIVGSMLANFVAALIKLVTNGARTNLISTAKVSVNAFSILAAINYLVTPLASSLNQIVAALSLSKMQADALFIGLLILVLLGSKNVVTKTIENLYKS